MRLKKVAFFYKKDSTQVSPLLSAQKALQQQGFLFSIVKPLEKPRKVSVPKDSDLVLVQQEVLDESLVESGFPIVILERVDGSQLAASRNFIERSNVLAVIKNSIPRDVSLHDSTRGRFHTILLGRPPQQTEPLSSLAKSKICLGYSYAVYPQLQPFLKAPCDLKSPRNYMVSYAGTDRYSDPYVTAHRQKAKKMVNRFGKRAYTKKVGLSDYLGVLRRTRVLVSPWGFGEVCYRDFEAALMGCVLVKPRSDYVLTEPDMFRDDVTYASCLPNLEDLNEVIVKVDKEWDDWYERRRQIRQQVLAVSAPEFAAKRVSNILRSVV